MTGERPIALITGAAQRVGRAVSLELARCGYDIVFTYRTSEAEAGQTASDIESLGVSARRERLDLADPKAVIKWGKRWASELPRLDALVHNASVYEATPWGTVSPESLMEHYVVNAASPLLLTQELTPLLKRSQGSVVVFCDIHAMGRPRRRLAAYALSKGAAVEMVHTLARELAPEVRVNGVAPGVVAWPPDTPDDEIRRYEARIPLGRSGTPEDAAAVVRFLLHEGRYVNGDIVRVDGGRWLQ